MGAQKITNVGFLSEFMRRHEKLRDRPFCWVLGSGASFQSGIPTGATLALQWLKEMHEMEDFGNTPLEQWATEKNLGIKGFKFDNAAAFYPFVYQRRYKDYQDEGYAVLEDVMDKAEPSYGYSVLAQIMASTEHKAAVTTNFDNLIADALAIYTEELPLVCGHESLTGYIRAKLRRPLIAKIHRDLLLNPLNNQDEIGKLADGWGDALTTIFQNYVPIVIGYGGNDGSLMGFLEKLAPINGGIFWCYRGSNEPEARIQKIVERHRGKLVPIVGFDELMLLLGEKLKIPDPRPALQQVHDGRVAAWQKQFEELNKKLKEPAANKAAEAELKPVREAAAAAVERLTKEKDWWAWQLKVDAENDPKKKEAVFREGLKDFPESAELTGNFALFMDDVRNDYDEAERLYRRAMKLDPEDADYPGNLAFFLKSVRKDYDEAERLYRKAIELDPKDATHTTNFAVFMEEIPKDYDEAERLYRSALDRNPKHANNTAAFADFLWRIRKDPKTAKELFRKAEQLGANSAWFKSAYAKFQKAHPK